MTYRLFYIVSLMYIVSTYIVLTDLREYDYLLNVIVPLVSLIYYIIGFKLGSIFYGEISLNKVFDRYVSINMVIVLFMLASILVYKYLW